MLLYSTFCPTIKLVAPVRLMNEATTHQVSQDPDALGLSGKTLDSLLVESIDEALEGLIGKKAKEAVYDYLERNYSLAREDIPKNIDRFFTLTDTTFGGRGTQTIAKCIAKRLWEKLGWKFEDIKGLEFAEYLELARGRIARDLVQNAKASMPKRTLD